MDDLNQSPSPASRKRKSQPKDGSERLCLTLNGFLIDLLRKEGPMRVEDLNRYVKDNIHKLRRSDGSNYKGDLYKILIGVLSNCSAFCETGGIWTVNEENARSYEESTLKNINRRLGKYRIKTYDDRKAEKLFLQRIKACKSTRLHSIISRNEVVSSESVEELAREVMGWKSESEVGRQKERVAGMMYMMELLKEENVLKGLQPLSDLSDMRRKVTHLSTELHEVEKWVLRDEDV